MIQSSSPPLCGLSHMLKQQKQIVDNFNRRIHWHVVFPAVMIPSFGPN